MIIYKKSEKDEGVLLKNAPVGTTFMIGETPYIKPSQIDFDILEEDEDDDGLYIMDLHTGKTSVALETRIIKPCDFILILKPLY